MGVIRIAPDDDVGVAIAPVGAGEVIFGIEAAEAIPEGHKIALRALPEGSVVRKYGYPIGVTSRAVRAGAHVHIHNLRSALVERVEDAGLPADCPGAKPGEQPNAARQIPAFVREDGRVATRNEIWIVPTVGCVESAAQRIALAAEREGLPPGVDGIVSLRHGLGCSQIGTDLSQTREVLAGLLSHPNAAGVLVLGLGCESNGLGALLRAAGPTAVGRLASFDAQDVEDEVAEGLRRVRDLASRAASARREPVPVGRLIVGLKCGGSDGLSGLTANPLVGRVADRLVGLGATLLLSEVPEMFGAEGVLLDRCASPEVRRAVVALVNDFRESFRGLGAPIDQNPSPGNREGGLTTLAEKSLGCVQKGGKAPVVAVLRYGERAKPGLSGVALVEAPGNDPVSTTALVAAGAQVVLFTTGRGTPLGSPVPTVKISSNSGLAQRKPGWIDFDAGVVATGAVGLEDAALQLLDIVLDVAGGGRRCRSEESGFRDVAIWKRGVTL